MGKSVASSGNPRAGIYDDGAGPELFKVGIHHIRQRGPPVAARRV